MSRATSVHQPMKRTAAHGRHRQRIAHGAGRIVGRYGHQRVRQVDNGLGTLCHTVSMLTKRPLPIPPSSVTSGVFPDSNPGMRGSNSGIA